LTIAAIIRRAYKPANKHTGTHRRHIGQKSVFKGREVGALQRNLSLLDAPYHDQSGRAETGRTQLPHAAHRLKRRFEAVMGLTLQRP